MSVAALIRKARADFDVKPHRYKLTFMQLALTNGRGVYSFGVINVRIGLEQPITPENEDAWLVKVKESLGDENVFALGFSKYE